MVAVAAVTVLAVAAIFAALGQGGALLNTPILHWLGYDLKSVVIPLALLLNGLTTLLALIPYGRKGLINWLGDLPMVAAALIFAPLGALTAPHVSTRILLYLFAGAVLIAALRTLYSARQPEPSRLVPARRRIAAGSLVAATAGFAGGMLGLGGGFIIAPLLMWLGYETKRAAATTAYIIALSSFSGFAGHVADMTVNWPLLLSTVPAAVIGSLTGSWFMANRARPAAIKWLYGILLIGVAVKLLL